MSMSNSNGNVSFKAFPSDRVDALALLYLQNQDLSGKSPEELANIYNEAWCKISQEFKLIRENEVKKRHETRDAFLR